MVLPTRYIYCIYVLCGKSFTYMIFDLRLSVCSLDKRRAPSLFSLEGIRVTRARELLAALVDPKIGDPLCASQDGAGRMPRQIVPLAVGV